MCGIAGFLGPPPDAPDDALRAMGDAIRHRGPDARGEWCDPNAGIGLAHRRLSILDLGPGGTQPMISACGRYILVYNGEIYNFHSLRADLERRGGAPAWQGHSDTEVLLALMVRDGALAALKACDGMFAFALWDREARILTLGRDAFGEKPLYYGKINGRLLFGSELAALRAMPGFEADLNLGALGAYFRYSYVPAPMTIWENIFKLPPGHVLQLGKQSLSKADLPDPIPWWDAVGEAMQARKAGFDGDFQEATAQVDRLLSASVERRMVSDVPLGVLLSGGIDSAMTAALMQAQSARPLRSFCIGMNEEGFDESSAAEAIARHLGTDHKTLRLNAQDVQAAIPEVIPAYDEPFADSSQVPTWLVARMARMDVTVALSGDGGDEIFAGYNRYIHGPKVWNRVKGLPVPLRLGAAWALARLPVGLLRGLAPGELASGRAREKLAKLARVISAPDEAEFHDQLLSTADAGLLTGDIVPCRLSMRADARAQGLDFARRAQLLDTQNYLPDDVMTKVDRAAMALSLETRTPYLERDLYRFAWSLPQEFKIAGGQGKRVLREALYARVPRDLVDRPKAGFALPIGRWLRSGLRDWAEAALCKEALSRSGLLDTALIRRYWAEHLAGTQNHDTLLWNVLMFQHWHDSASC